MIYLLRTISIHPHIKDGGEFLNIENNQYSFDLIWEVIILPIIKRINENVDSDFRNACDFACVDLNEYKIQLEKLYKKKREWLKKVYLPYEEEPILDTHKIGAVLCRAIIGDKPFAFNVNKVNDYINRSSTNDVQWYIDNIGVNYKLAFYVSIGMVYMEIVKTLADSGKKDLSNRIKDEGVLFFYPKSPRHEDFQTSCIISLLKNDILKRDFDYLTYSAMLFQFERYNYIKYNIKLSELKDYKVNDDQ